MGIEKEVEGEVKLRIYIENCKGCGFVLLIVLKDLFLY